MKVRRKGKVYPSPSPYKDPQSVLKLLPVTILALASALPAKDQQVLAYMITRSIITATNSYSHKNKCKKRPINTPNFQKVPLFECGCFDCYTSFWYRWDSSPNRELIDQVLDAFEDHLLQNEFPNKKRSRGKKRDKVMGHCESENTAILVPEPEAGAEVTPETECGEVEENVDVFDDGGGGGEEEEEEEEEEKKVGEVTGNLEMAAGNVRSPVSNNKGLARKVLPDLMGLLNSRLWSLWSPSI